MDKEQLQLFMPKVRTHIRFKGAVEIGTHISNFRLEGRSDVTTGKLRDLTDHEGVVVGHEIDSKTQYIKVRLVMTPNEYAVLYFDESKDLATFKDVAEIIGKWEKPIPRSASHW
jgi:hypothetical protein